MPPSVTHSPPQSRIGIQTGASAGIALLEIGKDGKEISLGSEPVSQHFNASSRAELGTVATSLTDRLLITISPLATFPLTVTQDYAHLLNILFDDPKPVPSRERGFMGNHQGLTQD